MDRNSEFAEYYDEVQRRMEYESESVQWQSNRSGDGMQKFFATVVADAEIIRRYYEWRSPQSPKNDDDPPGAPLSPTSSEIVGTPEQHLKACKFLSPHPEENKDPFTPICLSPSETSSISDHIEGGYGGLNSQWHKALYIAALKGDWQSARRILRVHPEAVKAKFSERKMTALHVAAMEGKSGFVEKLVQEMTEEAVALADGEGYTALHYAAADGNLRSVKALVRRNKAATQMADKYNFTPLLCAASFTSGEKDVSQNRKAEQKEVVWYLACVTTDCGPSSPFCHEKASRRLVRFLNRSSLYDISLRLFKDDRFHVTTKKACLIEALKELARNPQDFYSGSSLTLWERCIYPFVHVEIQSFTGSRSFLTRVLSWTTSIFPSPIEVIQLLVPFNQNVRDTKLRHKYAEELLKHACEQLSQYSHEDLIKVEGDKNGHLLSDTLVIAAEHGAVEVIKVCFQYFPEIIWDRSATILQTAIVKRQENVVNLLNMPSGRNRMLANRVFNEKTGANILHTTAELASVTQLNSVPGSPFQLQRELQWYKEMEKLVAQKFVGKKDEKLRTPWQVFLEEHGTLIMEGETWMRDTSRQCMVVSALITSVVFGASITIPGGQDDIGGKPRFSGQISFTLFAIADVVALFFAIVSILMFLSILTSRFAADDFLKSLPQKLTFGLVSLFLSIVAMLVAFGLAVTLLFQGTWTWIFTLLAVLLAIMFARLQLPLFVQMFRSSFGSGSKMFHPEDIWQLVKREQ